MSDELEQSPDLSNEVSEQATESQVSETESADKPNPILDLESVEKFRYAGREWTPKDFQGAFMMQSDYTRKTMALAEERKYYDNLSFDLENVKHNPTLAEKFKGIYPEKFHRFLDYALQNGSRPGQPSINQAVQGMDPETAKEVKEAVQYYKQQRVQATEAELDNKFKKFSEKYPLADEEAVVARALTLINRGETLTDPVWDGLWKSVNEQNQKKYEQHYSQKVQQQKSTNSKGKDVAAGGGIPGTAPKLPRTIKEASTMLMKDWD